MKRIALLLAALLCPWGAWAKPSHVVLGYSASWMDPFYPPSSYNWDALSHVARSFLQPRADGSILETAGFFAPGLEEGARRHGVKLIASLGGAGVSDKVWNAIASDPAALKAFLANLKKLVNGRKWDGVDIDWEPGPLNARESENYTRLLLALRQDNPGWIVTSAMTVGNYWSQHRQWSRYFPALDFVNAMTYDLAGDWVGRSSHDNALYLPAFGKGDPMLASVDAQARNLVETYKVPKARVLLGLRFDGFAFGTARMGDKFEAGVRKKAQAYDYFRVLSLLKTGLYREGWDQVARAPYLERKDGVPQTITYNNERSIREKVDYVKKEGYAGVIIWALGGDVVDGRSPLLDAIAAGFGAQPAALKPADLGSVLGHRVALARQVQAEITRRCAELKEAGQLKQAAELAPAPLPAWLGTGKADLAGLRRAEDFVGQLDARQAAAADASHRLPAEASRGQRLGQRGQALLVDDFEDGDLATQLGGGWEVDCDKGGLGSTINPSPLVLSAGGATPQSRKHLRIWGHFGKNLAPWPHANATLRLLKDSAAADLSNFRRLEFWAKGNGKTYEVLLQRAAVRDFCHFRISFQAPKAWTKVSLELAKAEQPSWGKRLEWSPADVRNLVFTIAMASSNDEDYDLAIDDLRLVP